MKVHLIKRQTIHEYLVAHAASKVSFENWLQKVKHADWDKADDIKRTFNSADVLGKGCNRVVFDIGGNNYRMICKYAFGERQAHLFVCWIGTHAEYDKLCKAGEQYTKNSY